MRHHARPDLNLMVFQGMVSVAPEMAKLFTLLEKVARSDASVLVRGESGTGKELVARAVHSLSPREKGPYQALNCATLTPEMLVSELFGHVKGAFTGAVRDRPGLLRGAHRGTVFLDEVAELPLDIQARLLRVLQEKSFIPLGGTDRVKVDVRFVSATHVALREAVESRRFREDLMYRIRVIPVYLPRLVERTGDIEALTWHFIDQFNARGWRTVTHIADDARDALFAYSWRGNIRELQNVMEYAFVLGEGGVLTLSELPPELSGEGPQSMHRPGAAPVVPAAPSAPVAPQAATLDSTERAAILEALAQTGGKKGLAADALGMSRSTLWRKMREHRI